MEPSSVILRDPTGKTELRIAEQNYRSDPVSQGLLLSQFEGQTIDFQVMHGDTSNIVSGKIIRSGYVPQQLNFLQYGEQPYYYQNSNNDLQPLIQVNGLLQFGLPGTPLFPSLPDDSILKPTLDWTIDADHAGSVNAELAYVTGHMTWEADYNAIEPVNGHTIDLTGWVTIVNDTGKNFPNAKIKLMAGDVSKLNQSNNGYGSTFNGLQSADSAAQTDSTKQKAFDEYHLYELPELTTLRDQESKQVQMLHGTGIESKSIYIYDGLKIDPDRYNGWDYNNIRNEDSYGTEYDTKVAAYQEFVNSEANHLGMPLPKGLVRFYRQDTDGQLEFVGENTIDHTPKDETVRLLTGNAFDLVGERRELSYHIDNQRFKADESFGIKVTNHKAVPVDVQIVEHLYRADSWTIAANTDPFITKDAHTIEFDVSIPAGGNKTVGYTANYTW